MYEVKKSAIHGRGLFAKVKIPKGTVLGKLEGELTDRDGAYVLWLTVMRIGSDMLSMRAARFTPGPNRS